MRELKALEIAARMRIILEDGAWSVPSQASNGKYRVTLKPASCNCEDFQLRQQPCKHIFAARLVCERDHGGQAPAIDTDTVPKRPTYKQNWSAYNLAQSVEKHRFQVLLYELCQGIEEPPLLGRGRHPHLLKDAVFAAAFKVYSTFSSRRFSCDLLDAHKNSYLSKPIPGQKVNAFLENPALAPILYQLITQSSLPLKAVEMDFAPDSTGFSACRFVRWHDEKYGVNRSGRDWVKAHVITGVKTNIVTAARIEERNASDCTQFPALINTTAEHFTIRDVPADKAYLSHENLELVASLGGTAYIPFKVNSTAGDMSGIWEKMFHYYSLRREEFLPHYHKRSNVESTVSMIKAKFRDDVRSKVDVAMRNEVLCKILCHNICVVIQSQCELGIEPVFWEDREQDRPHVLPLVRPG